MAYKRKSPMPIVEGGTNASTMSVTDGTVYFNGTSLVTTATGTTGQILTSAGAGVAPSYQDPAASSISITGNTGGALTGASFTFSGGTTGLSFGGSGSTETLTFAGITANGGTVSLATDATASAVNIGTGAGAKTVALGSVNTTSATTINSGSGGIVATGVAGVSVSNKNYVTINTSTGALGSDSGPSAGIVTLNGDSGSATGSTVTLTGAGGITTSGSGSTITITGSGGGGGLTYTDVTGATQALAVNNGYIMNRGTLITATLPATAAEGSIIDIVGKGAGGWLIAQNSGQTIHFGAINTTTGVAGSLASSLQYDCMTLICITANTDFVVKSSIGNLTYV